MARDGAFPGSKFLYSIRSKNKTPDRVIFLVFMMDALLCLFPLINPLAFSAVTSITTIGYQISYAFPVLLRLTQAKNTFKQSDFSLGRLSIPLGWLSAFWLCVTSCFFVFPNSFDQNMEQNPQIFNYTCVVVGGTLILALLYWFVKARSHFRGPRRHEEKKNIFDEQKKAVVSDDPLEKKDILDSKVAQTEEKQEKNENESRMVNY
jgi:amino acid transporter